TGPRYTIVAWALGGSVGASRSIADWSDMASEHRSAGTEDRSHGLLPPAAPEAELDLVARVLRAHDLTDLGGAAEPAAVDRHDHVARLEPRGLGAAARLHLLHEGARGRGDAEALDHGRVDRGHVEGLDAEHRVRVVDRTTGTQVLDEGADRVDAQR